MDNKNSPQHFLNKIFKDMDGFIKSVESGEGMNLNDEQLKEYKSKLPEMGVTDKINELKEMKAKLFKDKK